jgi:hypothetical protein
MLTSIAPSISLAAMTGAAFHVHPSVELGPKITQDARVLSHKREITTRVGRPTIRPITIGMLGWMSDNLLLDAIMSGQQDIVRQQVREALGANYMEVNAPLSPNHGRLLRLDNAATDATQLLKELGQSAAAQAVQNTNVMLMIGR